MKGKTAAAALATILLVGALHAGNDIAAEFRGKLPGAPGLPGADRAGWVALAAHPTAAKIVAEAEKNGANPLYFGDGEKLLDYLAREHRPGDILLLMGAGNIRDTSERLCEILMGDEK